MLETLYIIKRKKRFPLPKFFLLDFDFSSLINFINFT